MKLNSCLLCYKYNSPENYLQAIGKVSAYLFNQIQHLFYTYVCNYNLFRWKWQQTAVLFFFFFCFYGHTYAYGSSQTRGQIGAAAKATATVMTTPDLGYIWDLCSSLQQHQMLNLLRPEIKPTFSERQHQVLNLPSQKNS